MRSFIFLALYKNETNMTGEGIVKSSVSFVKYFIAFL